MKPTMKPKTLYGVRNWNAVSRDGTILAEDYFRALPQTQVGVMAGTDGQIRYFLDRAKRDAYIAVFGGEALTLNYKSDRKITGAAARELLGRMRA